MAYRKGDQVGTVHKAEPVNVVKVFLTGAAVGAVGMLVLVFWLGGQS